MRFLLKNRLDTTSTKSVSTLEKYMSTFQDSIEQINKKVHKYNMVVPSLHQQLIPYKADREMRKILDEYNRKLELGEVDSSTNPEQLRYKSSNPEERIKLKDVIREIKILFSSI